MSRRRVPSGAVIPFGSLGPAPSLQDVGGSLVLTVPLLVSFTNLPITTEGVTSFSLSGQLVAVAVPEPKTGALAGLGLVVAACFGRRGSRGRAHRAGSAARVAAFAAALLAAPLMGVQTCDYTGPDIDFDESSLPGVVARDDSAATPREVPVTVDVDVTVTLGLPPVDAVAGTDFGVPVVIDVLANDSEDAGTIDSFSDAFDGTSLQPGSVLLVGGAVDALEYTPPPGFSGTVSFDYTIVGAGVGFDLGSMDTAVVTVDVAPPTTARIQLEEATTSLPFIESAVLYLGQDAIDDGIFTAFVRGLGEASPCVDVAPGSDVPLEVFVDADTTYWVPGSCPGLEAGESYTIHLIDGAGGLAVSCDPGIADPVACNAP